MRAEVRSMSDTVNRDLHITVFLRTADEHRYTAARRDACCFDLRPHTACAYVSSSPSRDAPYIVVDLVDLLQTLCTRIAPWIIRIDAVGIRDDREQPGF